MFLLFFLVGKKSWSLEKKIDLNGAVWLFALKMDAFVRNYFTPCGVIKTDGHRDSNQVPIFVSWCKKTLDFQKRPFSKFTPCYKESEMGFRSLHQVGVYLKKRKHFQMSEW